MKFGNCPGKIGLNEGEKNNIIPRVEKREPLLPFP